MPVDVLCLWAFRACLDNAMEHPAQVRSRRRWLRLGRCAALDLRGGGSSDPVPLERIGDPDDNIADIDAVLGELGWDRYVLIGEGTNGPLAIRPAVERPEQVQRLLLLNSDATPVTRDDHPWGFDSGTIDETARAFGEVWGTGQTVAGLSALVPDPSFLHTAGRIERSAAAPSAAESWIRATFETDVRAVLPRVTVPTAVAYTGDFGYAHVEQSRYLAAKIRGAELIEAPGGVGFYDRDSDERTAMEDFVLAGLDAIVAEPVLATVLFTDIVSSTEQAAAVSNERWSAKLDDLDACVQRAGFTPRGEHALKGAGDAWQLDELDTAPAAG